MPITIRYAQRGDEAAIAELLVAIHTQHAEGRPDLFGKGRAKYSAEEVLSLFGKETEPIFVAESDTLGVVGYAICQIITAKNPALSDFTTLYLDDLNVSALARRQGVGTMLLDACRREARKRGCYNLTLNVWAFNEGAIRFYEANGFRVQRTILEDIIAP